MLAAAWALARGMSWSTAGRGWQCFPCKRQTRFCSPGTHHGCRRVGPFLLGPTSPISYVFESTSFWAGAGVGGSCLFKGSFPALRCSSYLLWGWLYTQHSQC